MKAAEYARDLLTMNPSARLTILYVRRQPQKTYRAYRWGEVEVPLSEQVKKQICEAEERILARIEKIFTDAGLATDTEIVQGSPADQICSYAEQGGYDLIVIGARRGGRIRGLFAKSLGELVLRAAECPVLVVKA